MDGSFFTGDKEGYRQVFVTLQDAIFDPYEVFDHTAQLIDVLERKELTPTVFVLQTDGGPDHSLKRLKTKLALMAFFIEMDLDHLVVLCSVPNGSVYDKIERAMSPLNLPLLHCALKRVCECLSIRAVLYFELFSF